MGVACCAESRRKPQIIDIKTYISLLSDTNSIVEFCLNKIVINVKRYEIIDALGIFLNGIYSYLLKTQSLLFEKESQIEQNFLNDEAIVQLKSSIEKLKEDLITQDFLFDKEARVLTGKKILNLELSFKFFQTQLEKYSPLSEHRYLKGDFQKGFDLILTKTMVSSNYLEEEIKEILSANKETKNRTCEKCEKKMEYLEKNNTQVDHFFCNTCKHCLLSGSPAWVCQDCSLSICSLCDSEGTKARCGTCKGDLNFTTDLSSVKTYESTLFRCNLCGADQKWDEGVHHCYFENDYYDICVRCRSRMTAQCNVHLLIENQRWWKNQWTECPLLTGERGKQINEKGENATFELPEADEDFNWVVEWKESNKKTEDPEKWEYATTWGSPFGDDQAGCYVRRRVFLKRREKIILI